MAGGRRRGRARVGAVLVLVVGLAMIVAGVVLLPGAMDRSPAADHGPPSVSGGATPGTPASGTSASDPPTAPRTLELGRVGISAPIGVATVPGGVLTPPHDVSKVGIWTGGAPLGSETGTTLLAGHVNLVGQGRGALFDLALMEPGDTVYTSDDAGDTTAWRVTRVTERRKTEGVDTSVFDADGPRRLAVVTCGGELDYTGGVGDYEDNVYLYAEPR